jgi:hypothetical protein
MITRVSEEIQDSTEEIHVDAILKTRFQLFQGFCTEKKSTFTP